MQLLWDNKCDKFKNWFCKENSYKYVFIYIATYLQTYTHKSPKTKKLQSTVRQ